MVKVGEGLDFGGFKWVNFEDEKMKVLCGGFDKKLQIQTKPTPI